MQVWKIWLFGVVNESGRKIYEELFLQKIRYHILVNHELKIKNKLLRKKSEGIIFQSPDRSILVKNAMMTRKTTTLDKIKITFPETHNITQLIVFKDSF